MEKGKAKKAPKTRLTVDEMINHQFWVTKVNGTADSQVKCEDSTFKLDKRRNKTPRQCFCDDFGYLTVSIQTSTTYSESQYDYYQTEQQIKVEQERF